MISSKLAENSNQETVRIALSAAGPLAFKARAAYRLPKIKRRREPVLLTKI
jgi:hypothetical protein